MSTKTTLKRIALVAVSALGFGLMTAVAPANAASLTVSSLTAGTLPAVRAGVASNLPVTAVFTESSATALSDTITVAARILSAPAGSTLANRTTATPNAAAGANLTVATPSASSTTFANGSPTANAVHTDFVNPSGNNDAQVSRVLGIAGEKLTSASFNITFLPDVAGTYQILVSANATSFAQGNPSTTITVTTAGAPTSMSITRLGSVVEGGAMGAKLRVSLKDANGLATVLAPTEGINVTSSNTTNITLGGLTAGGSITSPVSGVYTVTLDDAGTIGADSTAIITFTGSGTLPSTFTSNATVSIINTTALVANALSLTSATGYAQNATSKEYWTASKTSHGFTYTAVAASATALTEDTNYLIEVDAGGVASTSSDYDTYVTVAKGERSAKFSISQALSASLTSVKVSNGAAGANSVTIRRELAVANKIAVVSPATTILSATGASNKFTVEVDDQYGNGVANVAVTVTVAGRNTVATTAIGVTDANGLVSYTLKDAGTTGTADTLTFNATLTTPGAADTTKGSNIAATTGGNATARVNYGTSTVSKVTVSGGSAAETVAGTTLTAIDASDNGPDTSAKAIKAVVTDANGNLLAGVPVTFTVDAGAIQKTAGVDYSTVYTDGNGAATTYVLGWKAGKQTITATAGGVSGTDYFTWAATDATSARVLSGTVTGNIISYKVVDRFGNPVTGVKISLSRTGSGLFGNGASTQEVTTDKTGSADASFTGDATVVAELAATTQAYEKAGEIAATAVTAAVAGTTKGTGDTLAPAGVGKLELKVALGVDASTVAANAAADAAAEAIDAANAATDAANLAAEAADAATVAAEEARDAADAATAAVEELATQVATLMAALKAQITTLANTVAKIAKKVRA